MLKFFRQIRYNLMAQNKTSRYFKYAFGEIILVVIGILIALQINNWNEAKNDKDKLNNYLISLREELKGNISRLKSAAQRSNDDLNETIEIIRIMNNDSAKYLTSDEIYAKSKFTGPIFKIEMFSSVYKDLINSGVLKNLKDRELKKRIFQIERSLENYDESFGNAKKIWDDYLLPYYHEHKNVVGIWDSIEGVPLPKLPFDNDLEAFVYNRDYSNLLASRARQIANLEQTSHYMKSDFENLITEIDSFLKDD